MKKSTILSQLALAGIASGMLALTGCNKGDKAGGAGGSPETKPAPAEMPAMEGTAMPDSGMMDKARMDTMKTADHECKGMNACKGQGGCAVTEGDLKDLAGKASIPMDKAGKAHSCKKMNECKGLGGCKG